MAASEHVAPSEQPPYDGPIEGDTGIVMVRVWVDPGDTELRGRVIVPSIEHSAAVGMTALSDVVTRAMTDVRDELLRRRESQSTDESSSDRLNRDHIDGRDADATRD